MSTVQLLRIDPALAAVLEQGIEHVEAHFAVRLAAVAELVRDIVPPTLALAEGQSPPWGGYLAIDQESRQVVGTCAFKSPPTASGEVEIAYFTFPPFERQGYATAMAQQLIALAEAEPTVSQVIAHTLPEPNTSTRILQKMGMRWKGEVWDAEDGRVWRWERMPTR